MFIHMNIPEIAITPEDRDNDGEDNYLLNLAEALTDVEELFDDDVISRRNSFRKKLKIKVGENDGYNTAQDDVEASDEEELALVQHNCPIHLEDIDMEQFSTEEKYGIVQKQLNNFEYLRLQSSDSGGTLLRKPEESLGGLPLTDIEDYNTECESADEYNIPDSEILEEIDDSLQIIAISDEMQGEKQSQEQSCSIPSTPLTPSIFPSSISEEYVPKRSKRAPTFKQMMKSARNPGNNKTRKKRRNEINSRKFNEQKVSSGNDSTDNESNKSEIIKCTSSKNYLNYDSDVEEENHLQFPVCKKMFTRNNQHLEIPEFDVIVKTDEEDFECEAGIIRRHMSADSTTIQKQLDGMASCYSFTKDKNETKETKEDAGKKAKFSSRKKNTRKFDHHEEKISKDANKSFNLQSPTDIKNICSPRKESNDNHAMYSEIETDEEVLEGTLNYMKVIPEINIPPPNRTLIIAEENKSLIPTVRILSLNEIVDTFSESDELSTDYESINSETDFITRNRRKLSSPKLPIFVKENVNMSERSVHPQHGQNVLDDVLTDIENLDAENQSTKNRPCDIFLSPNMSSKGNLSRRKDNSILRSDRKFENHTDLEYLDSSDDETSARMDLQRHKKLLKVPNKNSAVFTDTEDLADSSDDEIDYYRAETAMQGEIKKLEGSKIDYATSEEVMYLRGGGYTGSQWLDHDAEPYSQDDVLTDIGNLEAESLSTKNKNYDTIFLSPNISTKGNLSRRKDNSILRSDRKLENQTDLEYLDTSDDETSARMDLQRHKKLLKVPNKNSPVFTDTEDLADSSDDEIDYYRAETAMQGEIKNLEGSKIDYATSEEVMYLRGGGYTGSQWLVHDAEPYNQDDVLTDIENLDVETQSTKNKNCDTIFLSSNISSKDNLLRRKDNIIVRSDGKFENQTELEYLDSSNVETSERMDLQGHKKLCDALKVPYKNSPVFTDTEDLADSSDDKIDYYRAETAMQGEIKKLDTSRCSHVNKRNLPKIDYSASEEVMSLRAGGYTDTKWFTHDAELFTQGVMDAWEYFNPSRGMKDLFLEGETSGSSEPADKVISKGEQETRTEKADGPSRQQHIDQH